MTRFDSYSALAVDGIGVDPTVGIAIVASVTLLLAVAFMVFVALAPSVSTEWTGTFDQAPAGPESGDDADGVTEQAKAQ